MNWKIILAYVLGLITLPIFAYIIAYSGAFPVATDSHPLPLEVNLADRALHYASYDHAPAAAPTAADEANLTSAARLYGTECAFCHGLPNQPKPHAAAGMFPPPPQFFTKIDDDPAPIIFWRIKNGIRLTGMPGFAPSLSDTQIWNLAFLLRAAAKLPPAAAGELSSVRADGSIQSLDVSVPKASR